MSVVPEPPSTVAMQLPATALGSRATRAAALILDGLIVAVPIGVLSAIAGSGGRALVVILWILASVLYAPLLMAREGDCNGQTLAKQWLSLRVVTTTGTPVTFGTGIKRHLLGQTILSVFTFGVYSLFDYAWALGDANKQTLHDKIASTYVFTASSDPALAPQLGAPPAAVAVAPPVTPPPPPPPPPSVPAG